MTFNSVIPSVVGSGTIYPATTQRIAEGESIQFRVSASDGHLFDGVAGTCDGTLADDTFTIDAIQEDCALVAIFRPDSDAEEDALTVIPSTVGAGTIVPATPQRIPEGKKASFTITPASGFEVSDIAGTCEGTLTNDVFTTGEITTSCSIIAIFTPKYGELSFSVIASSIGSGSMTPDGIQLVPQGERVNYTLMPAPGFLVDSVSGTCGGILDENLFTTDAITADCSVVASFLPIENSEPFTYSVIPVALENGSISPSAKLHIEAGQTTTFTISPNPGYIIGAVAGTCGGTLSGTTYTTNPVSSDCSVVVSFTPEASDASFTIIPLALDNGSISPSTNQTILAGESIDFEITPDPDYSIASIDGNCSGSLAGTTFTTNAITSDCSVVVSFRLTTEPSPVFSVIPSRIGNGNITPSITQMVAEGESATFEITPEPGFVLQSITQTCGGFGAFDGTTYTTVGITADCSVVANFIPVPPPPLFSVLPIATENGSISPDTIQSVPEGETFSFTLSPNPGYGISSVEGTCGGSLNDTTFTITAISQDCTVIANFSLLVPAAPEVSLSTQQTKRFAFSWLGVSNATEYRLLENPDGHSGYSEIAVMDASTTDFALDVFLPERINASYILSACNSSGCSDSAPTFVTTSLAEATGYVKSSNTLSQQRFGSGIVLSADGRTMAIAASAESSNATGINGDQTDTSAFNSGAVYVFTRDGSHNSWQQQAYIKASNSQEQYQFGSTMALSADGNTLVASSSREASSATGINGDQSDTSALNSGAVYVFVRSSNLWSQQAYIKASNTAASASFGSSVALSADGNTLVVGASGEASNATGINGDQSDTSAQASGAVYLYRRDTGSNWSQQAYVKASNTAENFRFGSSVALSSDGNTLAVGSSGESSNATGVDGDQSDTSLPQSGAVYVFRYSADAWSQQAYIKASNTRQDALFGFDVALSGDGNTLAVASPQENNAASGIDGDQNSGFSPSSGAVYAFGFDNDAWSQQAYIKASNSTFFIQFGSSITLTDDGNTLAVGAAQEGNLETGINGDQSNASASNVGAVYLFKRHDTSWSQQAYIKASNAAGSQRFGGAVAIAGDGSLLAVGAIGERSAATGLNGDKTDTSLANAGAVYLF
ncbi:FG-GAP repeat protein [Alkalimonas sp.]|uniref:FG-GAP repeat protein n=1 Tax=Alkalimonas sp. TaxID=1872453 RepID=UPI00263B8C22|nr:FG-GAP repeat protein [Alkalimonas sp.]MCC5827599.1 hypothetical protein [Alkalimonas sp.]